MADDNEQEDTAVVEEEYAVWKKNTPFLYDLIISHPLEWPSLTVHWVPSAAQPYSDPSLAVHKLILGTHTSDDYPNYLMVADALLPASQPNVDAVSDEPTLPKVQITQKIRVDGEVNRARCMLQKPNMVGAKTSGSEVYEWVLATASSDTTVGLFDMRKLNVPLHALSGHTEEVFQVEWDPNHDTVLASYAGDRRLIVCDTSDGRSYVENTRVTEVETYSIASWHGTTVLWVELPTGELLVGVDSQAAAIYTAPPGSEFKDFVGLMSQTEQKFVQIIKGIFATLAGGAKRCDDMVLYARKQMLDYMVKGGNVTIDDVACAASHFFHEMSPLKEVEKDIPSTVHIACWMPEEHKYKVIEVGDIIPTRQV